MDPQLSDSTTLEKRAYLDTIGQLATGITVVTTEGEGRIHGMTANAVTSLSVAPMRLLVCVSKRARLAELLSAGALFTVNILGEDQTRVSNHFAGADRRPEVMPEIAFTPWEGGPRLASCLAAIGCRVHEVLEGGDHWIVIGDVVALHQTAGRHGPLIYFRSRYARLEPHSILAPGRDDLAEGPPQMFYDPW